MEESANIKRETVSHNPQPESSSAASSANNEPHLENGNDDRTFLVLDEADPSEDEGRNGYLSEEDSFSDNEIHELLDKGLESENGRPAKRVKLSNGAEGGGRAEGEGYTSREKIVLVEKNPDLFEILPDGWIAVSHSSGLPVYLHKQSRVCTFSKPYFLGTGSCRNHRVPTSAIPCLDYLRALEEEKDNPQNIIINGQSHPNARVVTSDENSKVRQITAAELNEYCSKRFQFKKIEILRFQSWQTRRKYFQKQKNLEDRPTLPQGSKLITCPIRTPVSGQRPKEWILNPIGKTYVCILHDYVQRALKEKPVYTFKELENTATPYLVTISINGVQYGKGLGSSKKLAKLEAAKSALEVLIPGMKEKIEEDPRMVGRAGEKKKEADLSFFDDIKITDPRVVQFCVKTTEQLPHAILLTCLQRNFGLNEMNVTSEMKPIKRSENEFTMKVGTHVATVQCQNKRDGKQRASQMLLQALHPHIESWGSLLRLYGSSSVKSFKEKKMEEQEITTLQSKGVSHSPNYAILNKLREEMKKLKETRRAVEPISVFVPPVDIKLPATSMGSLNTLEL